MRWESRLAAVEEFVAQEIEAEDRWAVWREESLDRVDAMIGHVPDHLHTAVIEAGTAAGTRMWDWQLGPFVKGCPSQ